MVKMSLLKHNFFFYFCIDKSHDESYDESLSQISFLSCSLLVDFYLLKRMGAHLNPECRIQNNFFEQDVFIESIMNFYEKVRLKPIEKLRFPTKI